MKKLLIISVGLLLISCASTVVIKGYDVIKSGDETNIDETELCFVRVEWSSTIFQIDDLKMKQTDPWWDYFNPFDYYRGSYNPRVIELLPGPHTLVVDWAAGNLQSKAALKLTFVGEAGHYYYLEPNVKGRKWNPRVVDVTNTERGEKYILVPLRKHRQQSR